MLLDIHLYLLLELKVDLLNLNRELLNLLAVYRFCARSVLAVLLEIMLRDHLLQLHVHVLDLLAVLHLDGPQLGL